MKRPHFQGAFTFAEMLIALFGSTVVVGALLFSAVSLEKTLHSAEQFASVQADQRRLLDYVCRDLRRAIGIASTTSVGGVTGNPLTGSTIWVDGNTSLLITLPGYYQSQTPGDPTYDQPLSVVAADNYVDYGSGATHAAGVQVIFRKQFDATQNCVCFFRIEANVPTLIVSDVQNLDLQIFVAADGRSASVESTFHSPFGRTLGVNVSEREDILLRNIRVDL
jgi:hypothetical protein